MLETIRKRPLVALAIAFLIGVAVPTAVFIAPHNYEEPLLVLFTALLAVATGLLWFSTDRLARGADQTARHQLRAYVAVSFDTPGIRDDGPTSNMMTIRVKNVGQTPARITDFSVRQVVAETLPSEPEYQARSAAIDMILAPNESYFEMKRLDKAIDQTQYVVGFVDYVDIYETKWRAGFGRKFKPDRDDHRIYGSPTEYNSRTNLVPLGTPGYNYDLKVSEIRKPPKMVAILNVASAPMSGSNVIFERGTVAAESDNAG